MSSSTEAVDGVEIRVPRETVNDDLVTIQKWLVKPGAKVRAHDVVAVIETSKAAIDVESPDDGFLQVVKPEGSEVTIGELIGRVVASATAPAIEQVPAEVLVPGDGDASSGFTLSKKAQSLVAQYNIDPNVFAGRGLVREADVIRHLEARQQQASGPAAPAASTTEQASESNAHKAPEYKTRGLFGDAGDSAKDRGRSKIWLIWNYVWRNWFLGNLVPYCPRGVINVVHKMRGVKMGRDCFIDPTAILETAFPENITLGDDVRITVRCVVMTHIKAPTYLRETGIMPAVLKPVKFESHSFIGVNSVIMPGVTVGEGAVVASGSVVVSDVAPYTMVSGNPAKVIKKFPAPGGKD